MKLRTNKHGCVECPKAEKRIRDLVLFLDTLGIRNIRWSDDGSMSFESHVVGDQPARHTIKVHES